MSCGFDTKYDILLFVHCFSLNKNDQPFAKPIIYFVSIYFIKAFFLCFVIGQCIAWSASGEFVICWPELVKYYTNWLPQYVKFANLSIPFICSVYTCGYHIYGVLYKSKYKPKQL